MNEKLIEIDFRAWYDGFSTFYVGDDGKVHRHDADKVRLRFDRK